MDFEEIIKVLGNEKVYKQFGILRFEKDESTFYIDTVITTNFSYSIFVSPTITNSLRSKNLSEPRTYIIDATFNVIPVSKQFKQLLIIHIILADHAHPFIYALMSKKSQETYTHLFQYIKLNILDLHPHTVVSGFEISMRNAFKIVFPTSKMVGFWFHFTFLRFTAKSVKITEFCQ
uniref:MULE transposase domain-containing protein n=1 Tax=Bactrocera latifrons TaxID=174628 RepID=A0A0K8V589_BACLA